ncbi:MAG TPA: histidine kinase [Gaiellaceae bacterium]|nr:histidine kinase [Gaiellaceae bacterium]
MTGAVSADRRGRGPDLPALLPGALLAPPQSDGAVRRTPRDWFVDVLIYVIAVTSGAIFIGIDQAVLSGPRQILLLDLAGGAICTTALWWRRRWPVAIAVGMIPFGMFATSAGAAIMIMVFTVAVHRPFPIAAAIAAAHSVTGLVYFAWRPDPELPYWVIVAFGVLLTAVVLAWGLLVRARRQLVLSLRDRAWRAEAEQQLRVAQARQLERARIAREMHDVLAHRISLLSLHAGALEFHPDAPPEEVARAAAVIRASAHQALEDLRAVIGVLRDGGDGEVPQPPQPTLAALPGLLEESRAAGMLLHAEIRLADLAAVPDAIGRHALRIVQEALTNARKHATSAAVDLRVEGAPGEGLTIEVRNRAPVLAAGESEIPGAGTGLVGLAERVTLSGGSLVHGLDEAGDFQLRAWLPWPK